MCVYYLLFSYQCVVYVHAFFLEDNHDTLTGYFHPKFPPGFMEEVNQKAEVGDKRNAEIRPLGKAVSPRARSTLLIKALSSGSGIHYSPLSHYNRMYMVTPTYFYIVYCYPVIRSTIEKVYN